MEHSSTMNEADPNLLLVPSYGQSPIGNTLKQHSERIQKLAFKISQTSEYLQRENIVIDSAYSDPQTFLSRNQKKTVSQQACSSPKVFTDTEERALPILWPGALQVTAAEEAAFGDLVTRHRSGCFLPTGGVSASIPGLGRNSASGPVPCPPLSLQVPSFTVLTPLHSQ